MMLLLFIPLLIGTLLFIFAKPIGLAMCKSGKQFWRRVTFGRTEMAALYPEHRAPLVMRIVGAGFIIFGVYFLYLTGFPFKGPGQFKAMSQAETYLEETYGSSSGRWHLSAQKESEDSTVVTVEYRFGSRQGTLQGEWIGDRYQFTEKKWDATQAAGK